MDKVIGLGKLGCAVVEHLTAYPEYRIYKIDSEIDERGSLSIGEYSGMDDYERMLDQDSVAVYLRSIKKKDEILLVLEGGDPVSGATLKILETIKDPKLNVLYIVPDRVMCSEIQRRDDKIAFNVLQEYARSGAFEKIFLVHRQAVDNFVGDVPIHSGDGTAHGSAETMAAEARAADRIFGLLPEDQRDIFRALWDEFEAAESDDAVFAKAIDRVQPVIANLETDGGTWPEFNVTLEQFESRVAWKVDKGAPAIWAYLKARITAWFTGN